MTQNKNICSDCKFASTFDILDAAKTQLDTASQIHAGMIDSAIGVVDESKGQDPSPVIDQNNAKVLDVTARAGGALMGVGDHLDAIDDVMSSPVCTEAERAASPTGCPKVDLILPQLAAATELIKELPKEI